MVFIRIEDMSYTLLENHHKRLLFDRMNLSLKKGIITSLSGPNGVGKTTLSKLIIGALKADCGKILIDDKSVDDYKTFEIGQKIGYLFQNPELQLFNDTIYNELMFPYIYGQGITEEIETRYQDLIVDLSIEDIENTPVHLLSRGEKQRVAIGTILMLNPDYMILDEPTVGLNQELIHDLIGIIRRLIEKGMGILVISHDFNFIRELNGKNLTMSRGGVIHEN